MESIVKKKRGAYKPSHLKKIPIGVKIPRWLADELKKQPNQAAFIEQAIIEKLKQ